MIQNWKQAYSLAKFELKHSKINLLFNIGILIILLILIIPIVPDYFQESSIGLDLFFLIIFTVIFQLMSPKIFRQQKVSGFFHASHFLIHLNQLPIKREIIAKYRFLIYIMLSIPFQVVFLSTLYLLSPVVQEQMAISNYFVFCLIWLCLSIYLGSGQLEAEAGTHLIKSIVISFFFGFIIVILGIIIFYKLYPYGLVNWTIFISIQYPILAIVISLLLTIIGWNFWMRQMRRKMDQSDYY